MTPLHNNIIAKKLPVPDNKSTGGIILPTAPKRLYEVVKCGPKVSVLKPGDTIKPFPHCQGIPITFEKEKYEMFNVDQLDDFQPCRNTQ